MDTGILLCQGCHYVYVGIQERYVDQIVSRVGYQSSRALCLARPRHFESAAIK